ncbi:M20 family metallo-hydrolase [Maribellus maritimus]|uniref:M20 family metallo-hydrolase n=1 Tax=Maribellus maritimus TaxID=2870838 RepID=UPI001EEA9C63|nr:M20 family metallo-hydrolase [Maribellus maritimus]MCG6189232.1 M20 family metallo-hydrolase [Maribellus maritimus]
MEKYIHLLKSLISTPSFSKEEEKAAEIMRNFLTKEQISFKTKQNNTWAFNKYFDKAKPTVLLDSHIDTVRPAKGYTLDPFKPIENGDKLFGLGSNDAGGPLVSLLATFVYFYNRKDLPFNLIFAATAEEEISGRRGLEIVLPEIAPVDFAIIGEPTKMELAIAEKGLLVLDCYAHGKSGHAARDEGENALYKALDDIEKLRRFKFEKVSEVLGEVKISVTQIEAGTQHNVVPDVCHFVADVRTNEHYLNKDAYRIINDILESEVKPRSLRLNSSGINELHPFAQLAKNMGINIYGSPTTSDQAIIPFLSVKMGPGDSARSHTADEYIHKSEIFMGIEQYIKILKELKL